MRKWTLITPSRLGQGVGRGRMSVGVSSTGPDEARFGMTNRDEGAYSVDQIMIAGDGVGLGSSNSILGVRMNSERHAQRGGVKVESIENGEELDPVLGAITEVEGMIGTNGGRRIDCDNTDGSEAGVVGLGSCAVNASVNVNTGNRRG